MAALVTTMAVKPLVSTVMQMASSSLLDQYKVMEGMEEQRDNLKILLGGIQDVIPNAEKQAIHRAGVGPWLQKLKLTAYESIEVFDEFKYEALRRQAKKEGHYIKLGMDAIRLFPTHNRIVFRYRMGNKLCKIVRIIKTLVKQMNDFGFNNQPQVQRSVHSLREDSSFIQDPCSIVSRSRDEERQKIVKMLVKDQANKSNLMVMPIVGMGGLGKTTLAQLVFNDPQVKKHFQLLKWVCVSDDFDALANKICDTAVESNQKALENLTQMLSGKRYLLVLDDVWNEDVNKWAKLKTCFEYGGAGSAILMTTRHKRVAQEISSEGINHHIAVLDRKFINEIIQIRAFGQQSKPVELVELVDEIANRCVGSPLAAKALGSVLRNKTTVQEWKAVSEAISICSDNAGILPILNLSYDDLPEDRKQCFAFCAIFPKDYEIDLDMLIQLWMANGFIAEQDGLCTEVAGKRIFEEMVSRSFFQDVKEVRVNEHERMEGYCSRIIFKIHDLMHDVALSVMERECVAITNESTSSELLTDKTRHLHVTTYKAADILNRSMKEISPAIQTLVCARHMYRDLQHVSKYSSLRALKLSACSFPMRSKHLHHLRYLDLSKSTIKALPEDISILYNLQTLNLSGCSNLVRLPKHMRYMTALRHLYINGCRALKCMPPKLGQLTSLQTLTKFVASTGSDCSNFRELRHLNIGGSLMLSQLENVTGADAKMANLADKKQLRELQLIWTISETDEQHSPSKVLEGLKSPKGLQGLRISSYQGITFPTWMGMLQNMVELYLYDCNKCEKLPVLCHVPVLHVLHLHRLEKLQCLYSTGGTSFTFPKLKELTLTDLQNFEVWCEINWEYKEQIIFPDLEKLIISRCPKLVALPDAAPATEYSSDQYSSMAYKAFPALKVLELYDLMTFQRWEAAEATQVRHISFPELEELSIQGCPKLIALPAAPLLGEVYGRVKTVARSSFPALKVLNLEDLDTFQRWEAVDTTEERQIIFPRLHKLSIEECPELTALPAVTLLGASFGHDDIRPWSAFPELKQLTLNYLMSFKRWGVAEGTYGERPSFLKLKRAVIVECPELTTLPEAPKLKALKMYGDNSQLYLEIHRFLHSLSELNLSIEETETTFPSEHGTVELLTDGMEKFNSVSPLKVMFLHQCNLFFRSSALALWSAFAQIQDLTIDRCSMLVYWPEKEFERLVSLRKLWIWSCSELIGHTRAPDDQPTSERIQLFPHLEYLKIEDCGSLKELFNLPPSLEWLEIKYCNKLRRIFDNQQERPTLNQGRHSTDVMTMTSTDGQELSSSATDNFLPCLKYLLIQMCGSLTEICNIPQSLRDLTIEDCRNLQFLSGRLDALQQVIILRCGRLRSLDLGDLLALEYLRVYDCKRLASLPNAAAAQTQSKKN